MRSFHNINCPILFYFNKLHQGILQLKQHNFVIESQHYKWLSLNDGKENLWSLKRLAVFLQVSSEALSEVGLEGEEVERQ